MRLRCVQNAEFVNAPIKSNIYTIVNLVELPIWSHDALTASKVALPEKSLFLRSESTYHGVQDTLVVEEHTVSLDPVVWINILWSNGRSLKSMDQFSDLLQVVYHFPIGKVDCLDGTGMDLHGEFAS